MTNTQVSPQKGFVPGILPWLVAGGALLLYLVTLNPWISVSSLEHTARVSGLAWQPDLTRPVYWVLTYPFHWLPAKNIPLALNIFSAVCAALSLALFVRSAALLPHDRTEEQRLRERSPGSQLSIPTAWVPPLFGALMLGLQLTFWENATAAGPEILDVLLMAWVVRCVLEFRNDGRQSWLSSASLVYAAGMTNSWVFIGLFPLFLISLVWIKGVAFFQVDFLTRMFFWGLAGLSFYLLLPLVNTLSDTSNLSLWQALKQNLSYQKTTLTTVLRPSLLFRGERPLWVLALPSLLPLLMVGIKWPPYFGDLSRLGIMISTFSFHLVHGFLLVFCTWMALDPPMSARSYGFASQLLCLPYFGAIGLAYFMGYFLLIFGRKSQRRSRPGPSYSPIVKWGFWGLAVTLCVAGPVALLLRNLPPIRETNGPTLFTYAAQLHRHLPKEGGFVVSDDLWNLWLAQAAGARLGEDEHFVYLLAGSEGPAVPETLRLPHYHTFLRNRYQDRWPVTVNDKSEDLIAPQSLVELMYGLASRTNVYYLHPSFGYYFEVLYPETHGPVFKLSPYPTNAIAAPLPSPQILQQNLAFWNGEARPMEQTLLACLARSKAAPKDLPLIPRIFKKLGLPSKPSQTFLGLAAITSRRLNTWGVELQRNNQLVEAQDAFRRAIELNPANTVAQVNLKSNKALQSGGPPDPEVQKIVDAMIVEYRSNLDAIINAHGPFDEPSVTFQQGQVFARSRNIRQGLHYLIRTRELDPRNLNARILLATLFNLVSRPDETLQVLKETEADAQLLGLNNTNRALLFPLEATAHLTKGDSTNAIRVIKAGLKSFPEDDSLLATAAQVYITQGQYSNALQIIEKRLQRAPKNPSLLLDKGFLLLQLNAPTVSTPILTEVMELTGQNNLDLYYGALLNRAIAHLRNKAFNESKQDYSALLDKFPNSHVVHFGLGEIAYALSNVSEAISHYRQYLVNAPTNTTEASNVVLRLKQLETTPR